MKDGSLTVRRATADDAAVLCSWWNDGAVMEHAGFPQGLGTTEERIREQIASESEDTICRYIIEYDGTPIGETHRRYVSDGVCEIGIKICVPEMQEIGLGKRILSLLIGEIFGNLGYKRINVDTNPENTRARRVYERLGFVLTEFKKDCWRDQTGRLRSAVCYALTPERFVSFI